MTRSKKFIVIGTLLICGIVGLSMPFWYIPKEKAALSPNKNELIRFHVIANSDSDSDQALKRKIRDLIVDSMTPEFSKAGNIEEARIIVRNNLERMKNIATSEIIREGKDYSVKTMLGRFYFPIKNYGDFTLPAGEYEAVRVVIGQGQGANWWCVLFPPVCFHDVNKVLSVSEPVLGESTNNGIVYDNNVNEKVTQEKKDEKKIKVEKETYKESPKIKVRFKFVEMMEKSSIKIIKEMGESLASKY